MAKIGEARIQLVGLMDSGELDERDLLFYVYHSFRTRAGNLLFKGTSNSLKHVQSLLNIITEIDKIRELLDDFDDMGKARN